MGIIDEIGEKMTKELFKQFEDFLKEEIDLDYASSIWAKQSSIFRIFWEKKIMKEKNTLTDSEIDEIVLILDKNAKGSTKDTVAVARAMIPQGAWRRLFREIQNTDELKNLINKILFEKDKNNKIESINRLYQINKERKNNLTGKSGNAINVLIFISNIYDNLSVVSLNDRQKIIEHYNIPSNIDFENDSPGKKIVESNDVILDWFHKQNIVADPVLITCFIYRKLKDEWRSTDEIEILSDNEPIKQEISNSESTFYMEKELENFLISNWDKTELADEYELIEEDGEMVSQQYPTGIGLIDILVKEKNSGAYVVIELKKNQTSDDTIGQITRYMGWIEVHRSNGKPTKGIIIASRYDEKLKYALKKIKDVEVYQYQVNFKLKEFKDEE